MYRWGWAQYTWLWWGEGGGKEQGGGVAAHREPHLQEQCSWVLLHFNPELSWWSQWSLTVSRRECCCIFYSIRPCVRIQLEDNWTLISCRYL